MVNINIEIVKTGNGHGLDLPSYATTGSAGMDLRSSVEKTIEPRSHGLIPCGFRIALPIGYEAQVRSRSGLALRHGIFVLNSPGTIDCDYRGEVAVILANFSDSPFTVSWGDRMAQLVILPVVTATLVETSELPPTARGDAGFGSTDP